MVRASVAAVLSAVLAAAVTTKATAELSPEHQAVVDELSVVLDSYRQGSAMPADELANFRVVTDLVGEAEDLEGVEIIDCGGRHVPFPRSLPKTVDNNVLADFHDSFSLMQDIGRDETDLNLFEDASSQFVATIRDGFVQGDAGLVFDEQGRLFEEKNQFFTRSGEPYPKPVLHVIEDEEKVLHFDALATTIQKYGYMYYHFVEETLPKLVLLKDSGILDKYPDMKILTWGQPYEASYLELLGIETDRMVAYEPHQTYSADVLAFPTPSARITPAKESLEIVRKALGADQLVPKQERNKIIYCSRSGESSRKVTNEDKIIQAIRDEFPEDELVIYTSIDDASQVIDLFKHAKLIIGPHGAGLSHILFAAPETPVVEFLFMQDPPMMFWHTSASINLDYWMVPVPQSDWMGSSMEVPIQEVEDVLHAIHVGEVDLPTCQPGSFVDSDGNCVLCSAGTYAFSADASKCKPCFQGQIAEGEGNTSCRTCPPDTYSLDGKTCVRCPDGTSTNLAGAYKEEQCIPLTEAHGNSLAKNVEIFRKLSPGITGVRGRMAQQVDEMLGSPEFTSAAACQLIQAIASSMNGDYLYSTTASLDECESLEDIKREEALAAALQEGIEEALSEEDIEELEAPAPESLGTSSETVSVPAEETSAPTAETSSSFWEEEFIAGEVIVPGAVEPAPAPVEEELSTVVEDIDEDDDIVSSPLEEEASPEPATEEEASPEPATEEEASPEPATEEEASSPAPATEAIPPVEIEEEAPESEAPEVESAEGSTSLPDYRTFIPDNTCPTGIAYQVQDLVRASSEDLVETRCIECEQQILASIQACQSLSDDEACCNAAASWNNGGCYCIKDSALRAEEAGATLHFMDLIAPLCGFERISPEDENCPETLSAPSLEGSSGSSIAKPSALFMVLAGSIAILLGTVASYT